MLDISLRGVGFTYRKSPFALRGVTIAFAKSTHTAIIGPPGCGASTLLRLIAGTLQPDQGEIVIGTRRVNGVKASARPILLATPQIDAPLRWSVQHALVAAVRTRSLDRTDRELEHDLAVSKWDLADLVSRRLDTLSSSEQTRVHLAAIELRRPGVLVADRLLEHLPDAADEFYRTMRVLGTTVVAAPASRRETGQTNAVGVLENGRLVQYGPAAELFARPVSPAAALATGDATILPVTVRGRTVESPIGMWETSEPSFQGTGVAIVRPGAFSLALHGEESDVILSVEEASFEEGRWRITAMVTGGTPLQVLLPGISSVHKGKLLPLRYDAAQFQLLPAERPEPETRNAIPPLRDTR